MGYTHYWQRSRDFTESEWDEICAATRKIIDTAPFQISICGPLGTGKPQVNKDLLRFNGTGKNGLDHETFQIDRLQSPDDWGFCKTARKPYDVVVTAVLTYLANCWNIDVSSDGDVEDWEAGVALAEMALGRQFYNPLIPSMLKEGTN